MTPAEMALALLTSLTEDDIRAMSFPRQKLMSGQLRRVHRIVDGNRIISDARKATWGTPMSVGVIADIENGYPRHGG